MAANEWNKFKIRTPGIVSPEMWNWVVDTLRRNSIISFSGGSLNQNETGTSLAVTTRGGGGGASTALPWAPSITIPESGPATVSINLDSKLFAEFGFTELTIAGLSDAHTVVANDIVFLQGEYDVDGPIDTDPYTVETENAPTIDANWEVEFDVETGPPDITYQKYWRVPICKIESVESVLTITEIYAFNHLQLTRVLWQGKSALLPQTRK